MGLRAGWTIVASASPPVSAGVGILRLSGGSALSAALPLAPRVPRRPLARRAYLTEFTDCSGASLDEGLFLYFRAPHSYTGEDVVELQTHGSPRLLQLLLSEVLQDERVRLAEPGEFTRRAFLNGRVDLARAEAVADLVAADSEAAVRAAAHQLRGGLSDRVREISGPVTSLRAELEGLLNFPVETEDESIDLGPLLEQSLARVSALLADASRGRVVRRGLRVVLTGPVNAGKSTLFNRLLGEHRALVDGEPGTTRDVLEGRMELCGLAVSLFDTAGLHPLPGRIESMGIERAKAALQAADMAILLVPPEASAVMVEGWRRELGEVPVLEVRGKADVLAAPENGALRVSGLTGVGIEELRERMLSHFWKSGLPSAVQLTSERHVEALRRAQEALDRAKAASHLSTLEVVSGELGMAADALGEITGESASAELLDAIFRRFCIGK